MSVACKWSAGIVWLHGLGDSGAGWKFIEGELGSSLAKKLGGPVKWLFPTAPTAPVSCNGGHPSTSWMDLEAIPVRPGCKDAKDDIRASLGLVHAQVAALEAEGIPASKIAVGGFSQGGAMSLLSTLSYPKKLAGGVVLSGWTTMEDEWGTLINAENKPTPIFWGHGADDPVVLAQCQTEGVSSTGRTHCSRPRKCCNPRNHAM